MTIKSQEGLIEAAQNGHLDSFAALYRQHYNSMAALAYSVLADRHLAEDAAQQTFAIACRDLHKLKSKEKFAAWLAGICRNVARQMQRSKDRFAASGTAAGPVSQDRNGDLAETVRRAVWKLRAVEREPLILRYYNGLSYEQISAVLRISPQAVHGRLVRAKRKVAKHLKRNGLAGNNYENA